MKKYAIAGLFTAGSLAAVTLAAAPAPAHAQTAKPAAIVAYSGAGPIHVGGSNKSWCMSVRNLKSGHPKAGSQIYAAPCGAHGYYQNWLVHMIGPAGNLTGWIASTYKPGLCVWLHEGNTNAALQDCEEANRTQLIIFTELGHSLSIKNHWSFDLYGNLLSFANPIRTNKPLFWFPKSARYGQVFQLMKLEEVTMLTQTDALIKPDAITGYHAEGVIRPNKAMHTCLTAAKAEAGAEVYVFGCIMHKFDPLQRWVALYIGGAVLIALQAHPNLFIAGIPGKGNTVELLDIPVNGDVPPNQAIYLTGSVRNQKVNRIKNNAREYLGTPPVGHQEFWGSRNIATFNWNFGWIFPDWIPETVERMP